MSSTEEKYMSLLKEDFTPTQWRKYFDNRRELPINGNIFNVYFKGKDGPVIIALHGGGYSGLTWALFAKEITSNINCQVIAIDLRGHGLTNTTNNEDLSLTTLANDVNCIVSAIFEETSPSITFVGHSMGGAIAIEVSLRIRNTVGLCVIDVVEGSALESLSSMQNILRSRPKNFESLEDAVQWSYTSGQTYNPEAARISMPSQIKNIKTGSLGTLDVDLKASLNENPVKSLKYPNKFRKQLPDTIAEMDEDDANNCNACEPEIGEHNRKEKEYLYTWRIDLCQTERFWIGWFKGMSEKFLNVKVPKILLLANIQELDTALTIGQMQGKFQIKILQKSGHAIHEDQPKNVADTISGFLIKQKIAIAKLNPYLLLNL